MGMFGGSRRQVFKPSPYDTRRKSRGLPRWFILLVLGILIGGGGVLILQASYGPKRLSMLESQQLTDQLASVTLERQQLQSDVITLENRLKTTQNQAEQSASEMRAELSALQSRVEPMREEIDMFLNAITSDVTFDPVGISGASFEQAPDSDSLAYRILIVQEDNQQPTYDGRIEVTFEGRYPNGKSGAIKALVEPFSVGHYQQLQGELTFPDRFKASRATLRIYEAEGSRALSYRTFKIQTPS